MMISLLELLIQAIKKTKVKNFNLKNSILHSFSLNGTLKSKIKVKFKVSR